jgi:hypothetical protein
LHSLFRWGHKRAGEGRDVIGMLRGNRESSRGKAGSISRRDRGSDRRGDREGNSQGRRDDVLQFSVNGAGKQSTSRGSSEGNSDERQRGGVNRERRVA